MKCRICGKDINDKAFSLGGQPISNDYVQMEYKSEDKYPLDLFFCDSCLFLQMDEVVKAEDIFCEDYPYLSSCSDSWLKHCKKYVQNVTDRFGLNEDSYVMEIASNDGCLLDFFKQKNIKVRGVEPARGVAEIATKNGIDTDVEFFGTKYASKMKPGRRPDLIVANNVIAHNPNVIDFVKGVSILLADNGVFTVEFPRLYSLIKYKQFDTIYHEHYSYFSLYSIVELFEKCGLTVFYVEEIPTHGGSLRVYARHTQSPIPIMDIRNIIDIIEVERYSGIYSIDTYKKFNEDIKKIRRNTVDFLTEQKKIGKRVVGYGAPAKGNTFLNYCGIDSSLIEYTVDRSDYKVGKKLPGSHIPIYTVDKILADNPDYIFILPWNIRDEIIGFLGSDKAKFITAIPGLEIL